MGSIFQDISDIDFKFENRTFDNLIDERALETKNDLLFDKCIFKNFVIFENFTARALTFFECKFENGLYIGKSSLHSISFFNCEAEDIDLISTTTHSVSFRFIKAKKIELNGNYDSVQFVSSTFEEVQINDVNNMHSHRESNIEFLVENHFKKLKLDYSVCFSEISFRGGQYDSVFFEGEFKKRILFNGNLKIKNLYLESSIFKNRLDIEAGHFQFVSFYRSSFHGLILVNDTDYVDVRNRDLQIHSLTLHSCYFEKDFTIHLKEIEIFNISNCNFNEVLNLNNFAHDNSNLVMIGMDGVNQGSIIFERMYADFSIRGINLAHIYFKDLDMHTFYMSEYQNIGSLSFLNIKSGNFFVIQDSISGKLNFLNLDINIFPEIVFANSDIDGANFCKYPLKILSTSKSPQAGYGINQKAKRSSNLKNVYNQLKKIAKAKGDIDNANRFESLEHRQLLLSKPLGFDSLLLLLNFISNNNGRSWFQGVLFTLTTGLLFFILYLKTIGIHFRFDECYQEYILFITSFPKLEITSYHNETWLTQLVVWLSRIFISYGIYQTVAAFRKYGKT